MTTTPESSQSENTYVIDAESGAEMARLIDQDALITKAMGGLFPEELDLSRVRRVLDIACGPGGWAQEVAFTHPEIEVVGIDISQAMIAYAQAQAKVQGLDNATFKVMDATKPLDFPDSSFDWVNARFLIGFMPTLAGWSQLTQECMRLLSPGGFIRLTECDDAATTNSPAYEQLKGIVGQALQKAGRKFSSRQDAGITPMLPRFLRDVGCCNIHIKSYVLEISAGTEAHMNTYENFRVAYKLMQPFLIKMGVTTQDEVEQVYQQAMTEILSDRFCGIWYYLTVWGQKPSTPS
jgi:ubiquinone/menaquinone biosynthesis C-methylase UbiE